MSRIAKVVVILCLLWLASFPLLGGGSWGKNTFASWAGKSTLHDKKAGVPILMLTVPILIAGSVASLFAPTTTSDIDRSHVPTKRTSFVSIRKRLPEQQTVLLWLLLVLPCLVYVIASAMRKLSLDMSVDKALSKSGNIFGMLAIVAFSWMLLPVSHRGPLGRLFQWDSIKVIRFHTWSGRIIIVASMIHGVEHTIRYAYQGKDVLKTFYFPPLGCWRNPQTFVPEICDKSDGDEGCSCYDHFLPTTGIAALIGLVLIGLSSMYKIRRNNFATFAMLHYVLTPLTFLVICIHYNKAILYASGSLLYYLASNVPAWTENGWKKYCCGRQSHIRVVAVEKLNSDDSKDNPQRPCIALTMEASEAAVQQFYPGAYIELSVPSISKVSHPFTVNRVIGQTKQIRVVFRVTGPFTRALENALFFRSPTTVPLMVEDEVDELEELESRRFCTDYHSSKAFPQLYLDGYYGSGRLRSQVLSHDVCVLVAAGIGVTPYLSLLSELSSTDSVAMRNKASDGLMIDGPQSGAVQQPKRIILHWICRDRALIDYCRKEYIEFSTHDLQTTNSDGGRRLVKVIIHQTGGENSKLSESTTRTANHSRNDVADTSQYGGVPFQLSKFSASDNAVDILRYFVLFSAISWGGLCCLWLAFKKQSKTEYVYRIYTLVAVTFYALIAGVLSNMFLHFCSRRTPTSNWCNDASEKLSDIELSTYRDQTRLSQPGSASDVPVEDRLHLSATTVEISEGRPLLENILEDLDLEKSCAVFCCLPELMSKHLRDCIDQRSIFDARCNTIRLYKESFEK